MTTRPPPQVRSSGLWLHLGGSYWQRASWDAIAVLAAGLGLYAFAPTVKRCRPCHWWVGAAVLLASVLFFALLLESFGHAGRILGPKLLRMEETAPK